MNYIFAEAKNELTVLNHSCIFAKETNIMLKFIPETLQTT